MKRCLWTGWPVPSSKTGNAFNLVEKAQLLFSGEIQAPMEIDSSYSEAEVQDKWGQSPTVSLHGFNRNQSK